MHAVACPILATPFVSKIPCKNIRSFACVCTKGCGGHKKGSRANDLPAMSERKIMGLMSLSSNCARSEDLTWETYWSWLIIVMWTPQSIRPARPSCCSNCAFDKVWRAFTVAPVLTSVETLLCTPELITRPTLGIVIPDSATFVHTMHDPLMPARTDQKELHLHPLVSRRTDRSAPALAGIP